MKLNFIVRKNFGTCCSSVSSAFSNERDFIELLKDKGTVVVSAEPRTKTMVSTSIGLYDFDFSVNYKAPGIDHIKTVHREWYNSFYGEHRTADYFKLAKNQNGMQYIEYVSAILHHRYDKVLPSDFELLVQINDFAGLTFDESIQILK